MSMAEQKAMLENYNKVKAEQAKESGAKKKGLNFRPRPRPVKTPFCAYCKAEGHWMKNRGEVICPKLVEKNARLNERKRESARRWRSEYSREVEMETGVGGWDTVGDGVCSMGRKDGLPEARKSGVKTSKNPFDMEDDDEVSEEEVVEEVPAVVAEEVCLSGAWAKPLKVGEVAEEKEELDTAKSVGLADYGPSLSWGELAEEKEVVETEKSVGLTDYDPNLNWGDQW